MDTVKKISDRIVARQYEQKDCGPACLLTVVRYYKGNATMENMRKLCGANVTGTTMLGLKTAAEAVGMNAEGFKADIPALVKHGKPCILHSIASETMEHYVVFLGVQHEGDKQRFIIGDPAKGLRYLTAEELDAIWKSKICLTLEPNELFKTATDIKKEKIKWIKQLIYDDRSILVVAAVIGIFISALSMVMALFSQKLIDDILPSKNLLKLNMGIVLVFALMMAKEAFSMLRQHFLLNQYQNFNSRIISYFFSKLLALPKTFFDTRKIGDLTARLNDTSRIQKVISQLAGNTIIDILTVTTTTFFIFTYSVKVGLLCLTLVPIFYFLVNRFNSKISRGQQAVMGGYAAAESSYISTLQGIDPIKNHNKQLLFANINNTIYAGFQQAVFKLGKVQIKLNFLANLFGTLFLMCVLFYTSYQVLDGHLKTGSLIALITLCGNLLPSVANLALVTVPINEAKIAFDRMFEFTLLEPEQEEEPTTPLQFESLSAKGLSFRFTGRKPLFKDVSFSVAKGEIAAIMGENGCGKSTLIQLVQKHYTQEEGQIIINGNLGLQQVPLAQWRNICAVVPQQVHIFSGTVIENIAFEKAATETQQIVDFLTQYEFMPFFNSLPQSLLTLVGDEGVNLSGGQKQMIAIARALYSQPQLLILDEATAAMDRESETFVLALLDKIKKHTAILFITHRLHVLKTFCDNIYIIGNGTIVAEGNHDLLLTTDNLYSQYWADLVTPISPKTDKDKVFA